MTWSPSTVKWSLRFEIEKSVLQISVNINLGMVYQMPDSSVEVFNESLSDIINSVQKENKSFRE